MDILCATGSEILDEVDGQSEMSALFHKMLPEFVLDKFGHVFTHLFISNLLPVSHTFLTRESAAIIRFHSSSTRKLQLFHFQYTSKDKSQWKVCGPLV